MPAVAMDGDRKEQFRALCTTLLREVGRAEDILAESRGSDTLDLPGFQGLLRRLEVECSEEDAQCLFGMLDTDSSGALDFQELTMNLRRSGVITELYNEGIQNALLTLVPAVIFAVGLAFYKGASTGFDFVAGYVVEDSLSVDNLFVFLLIFKYFKVPPNLQKTCLDYGIYGAVVLRALFIYLGLAAINSFKPVLLVFAVILLYASFTALLSSDDDSGGNEGPPELIKSIISALPTTDKFQGDRLFVTSESGQLLATPLALCILSIELSDILFAVDSVPAVFAVTEDALVVFTSNIAAILGLRSLYQVLSIAVQDLVYLEKSAAVILGFVGFKLVAEVAGIEISSGVSLGVIVVTLAVGVGLSLAAQEVKEVMPKRKSTVEKLVDFASKLFSPKPEEDKAET